MEDVFICFVSADKELASDIDDALHHKGLDSELFMLSLGDNLAQRVEQGLREARYGVLILSPAFFQRPWPRYDLDQLVTTERAYESRTLLLPVWHRMSQQDIARFSPTLASKVGVPTDWGIEAVVEEIANTIRPLQSTSRSYENSSFKRPPQKLGSTPSDPQRLHSILVANFSNSELWELAFSLQIDYDELSGETKSRKAIELIGYCQRRGRMGELEQAVLQRRPHLQW